MQSYIKFKSKGILKGITAIFLKQNGVRNAYGIKLEEKIEMCKKHENYFLIEEYKDGILYYNGNKIDLNEYLKGNVIMLEDEKANIEFLDLLDFDKLL